ncbi:MAG: hypothetical protein ACJ8F3_11650 [Xanthobacteraceae bacterium]
MARRPSILTMLKTLDDIMAAAQSADSATMLDDILGREQVTDDERRSLTQAQRDWDERVQREQWRAPDPPPVPAASSFSPTSSAQAIGASPGATSVRGYGAHLSRRGLALGGSTIAAAALGGIAIYASTRMNGDAYARRAEENVRKGKLDAGIADYGEAIRLYTAANPRDWHLADLYTGRGDAYFGRASYSLAIADYSSALRLARKERALLRRAESYLRSSSPDRTAAVADYVEAVRMSPTNDVVWLNLGDEAISNRNPALALNFFLGSVATFQLLVRADAAATRWQRDLMVAYSKLGRVLRTQERLSEARQVYGESLKIWRTLTARNNSGLQDDLKAIADGLGGLSWRLLLKKDFGAAFEVANQSVTLTPRAIWMYTNLAHALLFLGRVQQARALYLKYRGEREVQGSRSWEAVVLDDFDDMRKAGLTHWLMDQIEKLFAG